MRPPLRLMLHATSLFLGAVAAGTSAETLYVPSQFATIQAALAQARIDRLSPDLSPTETIVIHVSAGRYVEAFPLILDVPNLRLEGETTLMTDGDGLPTGLIDSGETRLVAKPPLAAEQTILLIGPTSSDLTGNGVTVEGFVVDAGKHRPVLEGSDITLDRVSGFSIRRNVLTGSASFGVNGRASSGVIEENFISGVGCGTCIAAGNEYTPATYSFARNRTVDNAYAGVFVAGTASADALHPALVPVMQPAGTTFNSVRAVISGNDVSHNNRYRDFSSGIRLTAILPTLDATQNAGDLEVIVTNNTIMKNSFGITIDAGFPFRADPGMWIASFQTTFSGNSIFASKAAPALISFTRSTTAIDPRELNVFKYLDESRIVISDPDGDLIGYWFDHPALDPIDGRSLNNTLVINGVAIPNGRNFK